MSSMSKRDAEETRGERLRRLRKAKGLSLEEIHQRTKIHIRVLKALEEDTLAEISPAYVKGLLKIYCTFLGVDPKDFIPGHSKKDEPVKEEKFTSSESGKEPPVVKPRGSIALIKKQLGLKPTIFVICALILVIVIFKLGKSISLDRASRSNKAQPAKTVAKKQEIHSSVSAINKPRLGIRAKEDCWLQVKADGKTIFKGILKKGYFEYWEAKELIELSLGNAGGVDVELNGERLPPLGRRGQVIKNIRITKQGLKTPK